MVGILEPVLRFFAFMADASGATVGSVNKFSIIASPFDL